MTGEVGKLLGHDRQLTVRELVMEWAPETDADPVRLRNKLITAIASGEMDGTATEPGLFHVDTESGKFWSIRGRDVVAALEGKFPARKALEALVEAHGIAVSRSAVLDFCNARAMSPPSFWNQPDQDGSQSDQDAGSRRGTKAPTSAVKAKIAADAAELLETMARLEVEHILMERYQVSRAVVRSFLKSPRARGHRIAKSANE